MDEFQNPRSANSSDLTSMLLALTLTFIALSFCLFIASQLNNIHENTDTMKWQSTNADKVIKSKTEQRENLVKTVETRKALVAQSEQTQNQFTGMMKELDELARGGDKDASLIIQTYGIKVNEPPAKEGSTPAPAPAEKKEEKKDEKKEDKPK